MAEIYEKIFDAKFFELFAIMSAFSWTLVVIHFMGSGE